MSIDDDYFDLEDAIEKGELGDYGPMVSRILEALTDQEKLTMALQDKLKVVDSHMNGELYDKAELEHQIKSLKNQIKRLKKAA